MTAARAPNRKAGQVRLLTPGPDRGRCSADLRPARANDRLCEAVDPAEPEVEAGSSRRRGFVGWHGNRVCASDLLRPDQLQGYLHTAIEGVPDMPLFRAEGDRERRDAVGLDGLRQWAGWAVAGELDGNPLGDAEGRP